MLSVAENNCHTVDQQNHHNTKQLRIVSSRHSSLGTFDRSKSRNSGQRKQRNAVSPARVSGDGASDRNALFCLCCIRRQDKAVPSSPAPSAAEFGPLPVMTMAPAAQNGGEATMAQPTPVELCVLQLNGVATERQQKQRKKKKRSSTFSASPASRSIFPRLHRSLSSQQQHKIFRANATAHPPPPLDLRALDAADGTPNNTTDYLEVGRAEGGWIRDSNFWRRQQHFWQMQNHHQQQQQRNTVEGGTVVVALGQQPHQQEHHLDMETARTSRTEDIAQYPSMDTLIDEILLTDFEEGKKNDDDDDKFKQYTPRPDGRIDVWASARNWSGDGCDLEAVVPCHPSPCSSSSTASDDCSPTCDSPFSAAAPASPPAVPSLLRPAGATAFLPAVFFTSTATDLFTPQDNAYGAGGSPATGGGGAVTARPTALAAVPARPRPLGALPALTQSLFDAIVVTYVWIASSLALIAQWFL